MRKKIILLATLAFIVLLISTSNAQCSTCNTTNQSISGTQTLASGQKWCYTTSNSPSFSTSLTVNGTIDVCSGATLDIFGSLSINTGRIYLYDCSKLKISGSFTDFGSTKITAYCSSCGTAAYTPLTINGSSSNKVNCLTSLPVELLYFIAEKKEKEMQFKWATATEINNDFFTIEQSIDGENWTIINTIKGAGNSNSTIEYTSAGGTIESNVVYYRLKQTDFNGENSYSKIVVVENSADFQISVKPNPSNGEITVNFPANERVTLYLSDITGKIINSTTIDRTLNFQAINTLHIYELATGVYTLTVLTESGKKFNEKLVVTPLY